MHAVIKTGGKQYRVKAGDILKIEKLESNNSSKVEFDEVLMVSGSDGVKIGTPFVAGAKVTAEIMGEGRGKKIRIIKFKRRKNYLRRKGHRQSFTQIQITNIAAA